MLLIDASMGKEVEVKKGSCCFELVDEPLMALKLPLARGQDAKRYSVPSELLESTEAHLTPSDPWSLKVFMTFKITS